MTSQISIVALDLDDTLVRSDYTISDRTLGVLHQWSTQRGPVVIATGRPPRWTRKIPDELHAFPWVCYNGAVAYEKGQEVYRNLLDSAVVHRLVKLFLEETPEQRIGLEIDDIHYSNQAVEGRTDIQRVDDLIVRDKSTSSQNSARTRTISNLTTTPGNPCA
ncbi:Cof-type HAD-IIB family hydrolase [Chloroflexi bacterium TSY]|nr:Cof-type HAD-IIB family hydrolase [Chloroflexi bacterium TSY]